MKKSELINKLKGALDDAVEVNERPPTWFRDGGFTVDFNAGGFELEVSNRLEEDEANRLATFIKVAILEMVRGILDAKRPHCAGKE